MTVNRIEVSSKQVEKAVEPPKTTIFAFGRKKQPKIRETNKFRIAFGPLNSFFRFYGIYLHDDQKSCCRYFSFIFFTIVSSFYYGYQIYVPVHEVLYPDPKSKNKLAKKEADLTFCVEIFFTGARLYLMMLAYWSMFFKQNKLRQVSARLNDMAFLTIGHDSLVFATVRKRNRWTIFVIYVGVLLYAAYYFLYDSCYVTCTPDLSKSNPKLRQLLMAKAIYLCVKCNIIGTLMTISALVTLPFEYVVIVTFLQYCNLLAKSFVSMTEKHGLQRFPSRLYPYKAARYIDYHVVHTKIVSHLDDIFRVLVITWHGLECLLVVFAIRKMELQSSHPKIAWPKVALIVFNIALFAIKSIIPAKVNHQVTESLRGLTVISKSKTNGRIQNTVQVYEPHEMFPKVASTQIHEKMKLYIETILTDIPMITGYGMYNISSGLLLEAFSQLLTYVIVLYGVPT